VVYCPHSRLAARQANDVIASWLDRSSAAWLGSFAYFTQPVVQPAVLMQAVVQPVVQPAVNCKVRPPTQGGVRLTAL